MAAGLLQQTVCSLEGKLVSPVQGQRSEAVKYDGLGVGQT